MKWSKGSSGNMEERVCTWWSWGTQKKSAMKRCSSLLLTPAYLNLPSTCCQALIATITEWTGKEDTILRSPPLQWKMRPLWIHFSCQKVKTVFWAILVVVIFLKTVATPGWAPPLLPAFPMPTSPCRLPRLLPRLPFLPLETNISLTARKFIWERTGTGTITLAIGPPQPLCLRSRSSLRRSKRCTSATSWSRSCIRSFNESDHPYTSISELFSKLLKIWSPIHHRSDQTHNFLSSFPRTQL